jgi:ribonuclease P protein component
VKESQTFPKEEKLKSRKMISKIFSEGSVVKAYPIRIQFIFHNVEGLPECQVGVSVPKRYFKKAVDRNRVKRQIKEAYRLNRSSLVNVLHAKQKKIAMMIIFASKEKLEYARIEELLIRSMSNIRIKNG